MLEFYFFNDTATTEIYTLSLHDALPISLQVASTSASSSCRLGRRSRISRAHMAIWVALPAQEGQSSMISRERVMIWSRGLVSGRSEEHTSELQSRQYLVWRLLVDKKKRI